ncbi:PIR protein [Plasmodium ovale]|uniref:PIR protein n=1 Tax=Plasmodium ovale TaxID=36330 RepID=A0A1D3JFJ0_PLAOA|nr:PIR protein [Plasmodium ovale]
MLNYPFLKNIPKYERNPGSFPYYKRAYEDVCKSFMQKHRDKNAYEDICIELAGNLHDLSLNKRRNKQIHCVHLIYWLFDKEIFSKFSYELLDELYDDIINLFKNDLEKSKCNFEQLYNKELNNENILKLYNYSHHIQSIISLMKNPNEKDYEKCCHYVKDCYNLYKSSVSSTCSNKFEGSIFCSELGSFMNQYETLVAQLSSSENKIPSLNDSSPAEFKCPDLPAETSSHLSKGIQLLGQVVDRVGLGNGQGPNYISAFGDAISGNGIGSGSPVQTYIRRAINNSGIFDTSDPIANEVINAMFTIIPFLFFLYKYTPIGTWVRRQILRKITMCICRRFRSKHPCFTRILNLGQRIFRLKRYHVGYQALKNF